MRHPGTNVRSSGQGIGWKTGCLFPKRLVALCIIALLFSGCDAFDRLRESVSGSPTATDTQPGNTEDATSNSPPDPTESATRQTDFNLEAGQTEKEILDLLGQPSVTLNANNKTTLLYGDEPLEFVDGVLTTPKTNILAQIEASKQRLADEYSPTLAQTAKSKMEKVGNWVSRKLARPVKPVTVLGQDGKPVDHSSLIIHGKITVIDFYATWCGPCQQLSPILSDMVRGQPDVILRKVDIGTWGSRTADKYNVTSVPNVRVFDKQGRLVAPPSHDPNQIRNNINTARARE